MLGAVVSGCVRPDVVVARPGRYYMAKQRAIVLGPIPLRFLRHVADDQGTKMILLIIILILFFGGLGGWGGYRWGGGPQHGVGFGLGTVLVILLICYLLGLFR